MARNKAGIHKLTSPLLTMCFFLLLRSWLHHAHSSHPDSTGLPAQAAQPHSVVRASSLNSLSPQQAAVIRATCPSHTLASPLLSSRHSSGRSGEAASCRPQHLHPPPPAVGFSPRDISLSRVGSEAVPCSMLNTVSPYNPTGQLLYTLISVQPGSAISLA